MLNDRSLNCSFLNTSSSFTCHFWFHSSIHVWCFSWWWQNVWGNQILHFAPFESSYSHVYIFSCVWTFHEINCLLTRWRCFIFYPPWKLTLSMLNKNNSGLNVIFSHLLEKPFVNTTSTASYVSYVMYHVVIRFRCI